MMKPWRQGDLDKLCGAYAVINAIRNAAPGTGLTIPESQDLLAAVITALDQRHGTAHALGNGITIPMLKEAQRAAALWLADNCQLALRTRWPFAKSRRGISTVLAHIETHLAEPNTSVIVALSGAEDHWTVIQRVDQRSLKLFDSGTHHFLWRRSIGGKTAEHKRYQIWPSSVSCLTVSD